MKEYLDHNAHKTRRDKTQSATSWELTDYFLWLRQKELDKLKEIKDKERTYSGKKAGER